MEILSLEALQEKEYNIIDDIQSMDYGQPVDTFMEVHDGRLAEDSETTRNREERQSRLLRKGSFPSYNPFG